MARRVLVVEDSPTQAERVRLLLEGEGYEVELARNGQEGLRRAHPAPPDLIISDVMMMPELDGYAFCQAVKSAEAMQRIPFVLLTERNAPADILLGLSMGPTTLLPNLLRIATCWNGCGGLSSFWNSASRTTPRRKSPCAWVAAFAISIDQQQIVELLLATLLICTPPTIS